MKTQTDYDVPYLSGSEIRSSFIKFFEERQHSFVPSDTIAPQNDPTLLFTNAGMNQFKSIFLGNNQKALTRAVNSQKCLRVSGKHNDLDEVGKDARHHTFFEMLGNWSFGDYGKREAIRWAWQLLTEVWKLPKNRLFVTIYHKDLESAQIWREETDIEPSRVLPFDKDNFWEMGATGPCGPCTEIIFDMGDLSTQEKTHLDPIEGINGENDRYLEIWNLVFIQSERCEDGSLKALKSSHVDTGAGLERLCAVIQKRTTNYDTDLFTPLIKAISKEAKVEYTKATQFAHQVIADHIRAVSFAIADGVTPGNEGRAYVIRRILRRASRFAHSFGTSKPFLYKLVPYLVKLMGDSFPELEKRQSYISSVIESEEKRFLKTLEQGLNRLEQLMAQLKKKKKNMIAGKDAFMFHDTFGFPVDLTRMIAQEQGFNVDEASYQTHMEEQRERARQAAKFDHTLGQDEAWEIVDPTRSSTFLGYKQLNSNSKVTRYREDGDHIFVCLDKTPFYAEAGGQEGDRGWLENQDLTLQVEETFNAFELHIHRCTLARGLLNSKTMQTFEAKVDQQARFYTIRHHSATHLLHAALKKQLGQDVNQQGSLVAPQRLRFDYTFHRKLSQEEIHSVEDLVNLEIQKNNPVDTEIKDFEEAKKEGAIALFGEKYDQKVRVLSMGSFSKELCGGTHVRATGDIGFFKILSDSSIAAGVRRIEALASKPATDYCREQGLNLTQALQLLKSKPEDLCEKIGLLQSELKQNQKELAQYKVKKRSDLIERLMTQHMDKINSHGLIRCKLSSLINKDELNLFGNELLARMDSHVSVLTFNEGDRLSILVLVGKSLQKKLPAKDLFKSLSEVSNARGGGKNDRAQGSSNDPKCEDALMQKALETCQKHL